MVNLIGVEYLPNLVQVNPSVAAKGYNSKIVLVRDDGNKTMYALVSPDTDGSLKIIDFSKPF